MNIARSFKIYPSATCGQFTDGFWIFYLGQFWNLIYKPLRPSFYHQNRTEYKNSFQMWKDISDSCTNTELPEATKLCCFPFCLAYILAARMEVQVNVNFGTNIQTHDYMTRYRMVTNWELSKTWWLRWNLSPSWSISKWRRGLVQKNYKEEVQRSTSIKWLKE